MKKELRKELISKRKEVANKAQKDSLILNSLFHSKVYEECETVLTYVSVNNEVDTRRLIEKAFYDNKRVAVPRCTERAGEMDFYLINSLSDLKIGKYGIPEPDIIFNKILEDFEKSIIIVPGVSFSNDGYRLGYGGGYYDRFLASYSGVSVGLCYDELLADNLPVDKHDLPVTAIITDKSIINVGG